MAPSTRLLLRSFLTLLGFSHFVTGAPHPLVSRRALSDPFPFSPGFDIQSVAALSEQLPSHSWEYGTESEVLLELYNPELSVFGPNPFPPLLLDASNVQALVYAKSKIELNLSDNAGANVLSNGDGATGDPASLGVPAVLLGLSDVTYMEAAEKTMGYLVGSAPRWANGAISHRADVAELWADHIYMAPPFLAYYAAITYNVTLLQEAVNQCSHYREVLVTSPSNPSINPTLDAEQKASVNGLWHHIIGPQSTDLGLWSTGNAWAAGGITRVLATVLKAPVLLTLGWKDEAVSGLTALLKEILDTAILHQDITVDPENGFLRNYLDDRNGTAEAGHGFGEISGSAMLSAVVYRLAVLAPELVPVSSPYFEFAESIRSTLGSGNHISADGTAAPAVNPLCWQCTDPFTTGSPEGQSFVVALYTGWRDCVKAGICPLD